MHKLLCMEKPQKYLITIRAYLEALKIPFIATRYHSLVIEKQTLPNCFDITAWTDDNEIMGIKHKELAIEGVQFHPESILSEHGHDLLKNFLDQNE